MTWHLKDRKLEEKLIAIDSDFIDNLNNSVEYHKENKTVEVGFGDGIGALSRFAAEFRWGELEEIKEYDQNKWNEYPAVTPPEQQLMMFHGKDKFGRIYIGSAVFVSGCWLIPNMSGIIRSEGTYLGCEMCVGYLKSGQFRPWED